MKTILVPTQDIPAMESTLETAVLLAKRTGAYVEGVPLWFGVPEFVVAELASAFSIEVYRARRQEGTAGARKLFETFMQEHGVAARSTTDGPTYGWFAEVPPGEGLIGSHGRAFDVIVMSRPDADTVAPYNRAIESGLFESGRPVLLAPPKIVCRSRFLVKAPLINRSHPSAMAAARTASPVLWPSRSMLTSSAAMPL